MCLQRAVGARGVCDARSPVLPVPRSLSVAGAPVVLGGLCCALCRMRACNPVRAWQALALHGCCCQLPPWCLVRVGWRCASAPPVRHCRRTVSAFVSCHVSVSCLRVMMRVCCLLPLRDCLLLNALARAHHACGVGHGFCWRVFVCVLLTHEDLSSAGMRAGNGSVKRQRACRVAPDRAHACVPVL